MGTTINNFDYVSDSLQIKKSPNSWNHVFSKTAWSSDYLIVAFTFHKGLNHFCHSVSISILEWGIFGNYNFADPSVFLYLLNLLLTVISMDKNINLVVLELGCSGQKAA